jgi:hypothetical protein
MDGYEIWFLSLPLREEHTQKSENRLLRRISGPKTDEVTARWMKLHNGELHNLRSLPN